MAHHMARYLTRRFANTITTALICAVSHVAVAQQTAPVVAAPVKPAAVGPAPAPTATPVAIQKAQLLFPAFNDAQYRGCQTAGRPTLLVFAQHGHPVWLKQAPTLQVIMRSADRIDADVFQVDITDRAVCSGFKVTAPGTILVMKDGMERLRGNGMVREAALKKFLRLIPTL